jgi:hypothetical protein
MSGKGSAGLEGKILKRFLKDYSIYSLYQLCLPVYRKREEKLGNKYSNLFSYIRLIKTRPLLELKRHISSITAKNYFFLMQTISTILKISSICSRLSKNASNRLLSF